MGRSELANDWQRWLADNLLRGVADEVLIKRLVERGLPEPDARAAVAAARGHPFVRAALRIAEALRRRDALLGVQAELSELLLPTGSCGGRSRAPRGSWPSTTLRSAR
ncbi:MAG: hypothetical protein IPK07_24630 [Deltaproteobacteria bacterium]|nr:hypothetical protein [Deltaproteobacteria bacterium]